MASGQTAATRAADTAKSSEDLSRLLQAAAAAHQAGRLDEAEHGYLAVLAAAPNQHNALQLLGVLRHQQGRSEEALPLLQQAIAVDPKNPNIRNNFGGVLRDLGRMHEAEREFAAAVSLAPEAPETLLNHGIVLEQLQRYDEAVRAFAACLSKTPDNIRALHRLSNVLLKLGRHVQAEEHLRRLIRLQPTDAEALGNLGIALQSQGRLAEAEEMLRAALDHAREDQHALRSGILTLLNNELRDEATRAAFRDALRKDPQAWKMELVVAGRLAEIGRIEQAQQILEDVTAVHADDAQVWNDAGVVFVANEKPRDAIPYFQRALELDSRSSAAYCNLGTAYLHTQSLVAAVQAYKEALKRDPSSFQAQVNIIRALRLLNRLEEAHIFARSALDLIETAPNLTGAAGSESPAILLQFFKTICDFDGLDRLGDVWAIGESIQPRTLPAVFLDQLVFASTPEDVARFVGIVGRWASYIESIAAQKPLPPFAARKAGRLRVGFLSSDLRSHSVARFVEPLLAGYDRTRMEIHCYSPIRAEQDPAQQRLMKLVDSFKFVDGLADREIAEAIRADDIDILIDLNGFTQYSRIGALAYKPAPVQMSWLGYPFTSGLKAIDYVVMDRHVVPTDETTLVEQAVVMPGAWICFGKFEEKPIDPVPPVSRNGYVTFGSLNNPYKFNRENIALWARVMREVPDSRFLLVRNEVSSVSLVRHIALEFAKHGISSDRIYLRDNYAEGRHHLTYYNEIDISLDTFPVTGGTTTCDAIWMGVPVVAMTGPAYHHRISAAILKHCGLDALCAETPDEFVAAAVALAENPQALADMRASLRLAMLASPLCDEPRFIHQFQEMLEQVAQLHGLR